MLDLRRGWKGPNIPYGVKNGNFDGNLTHLELVHYSSKNRTSESNLLIYNRFYNNYNSLNTLKLKHFTTGFLNVDHIL